VARFPWPHIYWAPTVPADVYHSSGHILQQLIMFYADRATNETFTAFIDTDAVVMTTVHPEALFEDGSRPIVRGMRGKPITSWWYGPPTQTEWAIGRPEVGCFMTFFPVIIRTAHFAEMRKSMEERHHMPFDRIFAKFSHTRAFSQFNIMMNWLFFHKRDEYAWYVPETEVGWRGSVLGALSEEEELATLRAGERGPHVHVTTHWKYSYHQAYLAEQEELIPPIPDLTWGADSATSYDRFAAATAATLTKRRLAVDEAESASFAKHLLPGVCHSAYAAAAAAPRRVFDRQRWNWEAFCAGKLARGQHTLHEELFNFQSAAQGTELNCTEYDCAGLQARHYQQLGCARGLLELPVLVAFQSNPHAYRSAIFERPPEPHHAAAAAPCFAGADGSREHTQGHGQGLASLWSWWGARMWRSTTGPGCANLSVGAGE